AAWIIEDDLAFTTGETPGIRRVFDYIGSRFGLPSDTTVRNTLAKLFCEMFETLKSELAVKCKIQDCSIYRYMVNSLDDVHFCGNNCQLGLRGLATHRACY
ncbi:hypothetical protein K438DRAFT_2167282, partial [Mycena galopus ATCC 62051]